MPDLLGRLSRDAVIDEPVALVAAHPDDEVLGLGSRLGRLPRLKLVHLTDGAPRNPAGAAYAAARKRELRDALCAAGAGGAACLAYGYPDGQAIRHCGAIVDRLAAELDGARAVFTHPYEHGHPDHDTAALAVSLACARIRARGGLGPERYEFASYHLRHGSPVYGLFWSDPDAAEIVLHLSPGELNRKRAAADCFASQQHVIARFSIAEERARRAPRYDFRRPAPPGAALYDRWGWAMSSRRWRKQAARICARLSTGQRACD